MLRRVLAALEIETSEEALKPLRAWPPERGLWIALATYALLATLYFLPALSPGGHLFGTDYLAGAYFFRDFTHEQFSQGVLPKWVPYIFGGLPLFANPGGVFHPVRLLSELLLPLHKHITVMFAVYFVVGGLGVYLLLRELGTRVWVALVGGLCGEFTGLVVSYVYAGHTGRVIGAASFPAALFFAYRLIKRGTWGSFAGLAVVMGASLLSFQIQTNYYVLLVGFLLVLVLLWRHRAEWDGSTLAARFGKALGAMVLAFGLAAINFLPFLGYIDRSPRGGEGGRGYEYSTSWSMPPAETLGLAVPEEAGILDRYQGDNPFKLHTEYVGALVLVLVVVGGWLGRRDPEFWFFAAVTVLGMILSFGGYTPLYRALYEFLPGLDRFRSPSIAFFTVSYSLVVIAGLTLEKLARLRRRGDGPPAALPAWLGGVLALAVVGLLLQAGSRPSEMRGWLRFTVAAAVVVGLLWAWGTGRLREALFVGLIAVAATADLWLVDKKFFRTAAMPEELFAPDRVVRYLQEQEDLGRIWLPPVRGGQYPVQGNYLMKFDLHRVGGEHGNQIQRYNEFLGAGERTYVDWHNFTQYPRFWDLSSTRYVVTAKPAQLPGVERVFRGGRGVVYENADALSRAYLAERVFSSDEALAVMKTPKFVPGRMAVVPSGADLPRVGGESGEGSAGSAEVVTYEPDRVVVEVEARRPALLVLNDNYYPGWRAEVDGTAAPVVRANHTFRGVPIREAGTHTVEFEFRPASLYRGLWISLASLGLMVVVPVVGRRWRGSGEAGDG